MKLFMNSLSHFLQDIKIFQKHQWEVVILFSIQSDFCFEECQATRRRSDVVTTSLCTSQRRHMYISNEAPNYVSVKRRQDVSVYVSTTSYWNIVTTSQKDAATTSHHCVSSMSQTSLNWNTQRHLSGTSPRRLNGTYLWRPISTPLRRLL